MSTQISPLMGDMIEINLAETALAVAKRQQTYRAIKHVYSPVIQAIQQLGLEIKYESSYMSLHFTGDVHRLASVVRILRAADFTSVSLRPKKGDTQWSAFYRHPDCNVELFLWFTSAVCKKVKVGTKLVETDIYETQCDGGNLDEAVPQLPAANVTVLIEESPF